MIKMLKALLLSAVAILMMSGTASATPYSFANITGEAEDLSGQLRVDVTSAGAGSVMFTFFNNIGIPSSLTDIYFDDGTLLAQGTITSSPGANFSFLATPNDLPGGNTVGFQTTQPWSLDSDRPVMANGINLSSEWVAVTFSLLPNLTFLDTIAALNDGSLRIGLHVQGIGADGGGDSYVNVSAVPDGGMTMSLLGLALAGIGLVARRLT